MMETTRILDRTVQNAVAASYLGPRMANTFEDDGSVTQFLAILKANGDRNGFDLAVEGLWNKYFEKLVSLAAKRLHNLMLAGPTLNGPEDLALSAFKSFCKRVSADSFDHLDGREDLWKVLAMITTRKAAREYRRIEPKLTLDEALDYLATKEPGPEFTVMMAESVKKMLDTLPDEMHRTVALKKLEGHTNKEIADSIGRSVKNVEYKLRNIRTSWLHTLTPGLTEEPQS